MGDTDSLKRRTVSSMLWKLLERGGCQLVSFVVQIALARILDPTDFGMLAIVIVFVNVGSVFVQSGLNTALIQAPEVDDEDYSTVFFICLGVSLVLYAVVFFIAPWVEDFYQLEGLAVVLRVIALLLPIGALNAVQVAIITRELRLKSLFVATISASLVSGVLGIGMALAGMGLWALVAQQLAAQIVSSIIMLPLTRWRPRIVFSIDKAKRHYKFGWKLLASSLLHTAYMNLNDLIIGKVFSASDLGFFNQGKRIPLACQSLFGATITSVLLSSASKLQDDLDRLRTLTRRAMQLTTYAVAPLMVFLAVAASPIVEIVFTEKWLPCVPYLQLFALACMLEPVTTSNIQTINALGRSDVVLKLEVVKKTIAIGVLLFTALIIGDMLAIAIGNLLYSIIAAAINARPLKRMLGYGGLSQLKDIAPSYVVSAIAGVGTYFVGLGFADPAFQLLAQGVVFLLVFAMCSLLFKLEALSYLLSLCKEIFGGYAEL